jgi:hypothetical protein
MMNVMVITLFRVYGVSCYSWTQPTGKSVVDQWKSSFEKAYSYYLVLTIKGTFVLKGAAIEFNGATYKTA